MLYLSSLTDPYVSCLCFLSDFRPLTLHMKPILDRWLKMQGDNSSTYTLHPYPLHSHLPQPAHITHIKPSHYLQGINPDYIPSSQAIPYLHTHKRHLSCNSPET